VEGSGVPYSRDESIKRASGATGLSAECAPGIERDVSENTKNYGSSKEGVGYVLDGAGRQNKRAWW
jgi:hypothetical protein